MKKIGLIIGGLAALAIGFASAPNVSAAEIGLNGSISSVNLSDGNIYKLTGDLTVGGALSMTNGATVTIDLNGFTMSKNGGQIIVNGASAGQGGTLTIVDSGASKGKIVCENNTSHVCVKTYAHTTFDGITIESVHVAAKTDEEATQIIKNSTLISSGQAGAIQNWGTTIVENSSIINTSTNPSIGGAIDMRTYADYVSSITIKDSEIIVTPGARIFYAACYAAGTCTGESGNAGSSIDIVIDDGTTISAGSVFQLIDDTDDISMQVKNNVTAPITFLGHAQAGAVITLNGNVSGGVYTVPAGVTLVIPDDVSFEEVELTVLGNVTTVDGKELVKNSNGTYSVVNEEVPAPETPNSNPDTSDNIILYTALGIIGLIGIGGSVVLLNKKL
ncbi:hypothetical protein LJC64_01650 [Ruminococcaceae bacterium OttesenSCG-928-A11]|nr:hypothetical protein [Ruminococcaceae bacterium OttesenSCG-928-A11]